METLVGTQTIVARCLEYRLEPGFASRHCKTQLKLELRNTVS
jgi:hypothetical protein